MQQHADQMGLQQQRIGLEQQDQQMRAPVYQAQVANYNANAAYDNARVQGLQRALQLSQVVQAAKTKQMTPNLQPGMSRMPSMANGLELALADMLGGFAGSAGLDSMASMHALKNEQTPMTLNREETAFGGNANSGYYPVAQGMAIPPFGSSLFQGTGLPNANPTLQQQGSFRPPGSTNLDPSTIAKNWAAVAQVADMLGMPQQAVGELLGRGTNAPTANPGMSAPVRVSTKAERDALPPGTQYIGPDGQIATKQ